MSYIELHYKIFKAIRWEKCVAHFQEIQCTIPNIIENHLYQQQVWCVTLTQKGMRLCSFLQSHFPFQRPYWKAALPPFAFCFWGGAWYLDFTKLNCRLNRRTRQDRNQQSFARLWDVAYRKGRRLQGRRRRRRRIWRSASWGLVNFIADLTLQRHGEDEFFHTAVAFRRRCRRKVTSAEICFAR